jgi:hypothetical protein
MARLLVAWYFNGAKKFVSYVFFVFGVFCYFAGYDEGSLVS